MVVDRYIERGLPIMFDTETTGLNPRTSKIISLQFKQQGFQPVIVDVRHMTPAQITPPLSTLVSGGLLWVGFNLAFDYSMLAVHYDVCLQRMYDVMLAEKILQGGISEELRYDLASVCERHHVYISKEERRWFYNLDTRLEEWNASFPENELEYMARDVEVLEPLFSAQSTPLRERGLTGVARLEFACIKPVARMELSGILVNKDSWRQFIALKDTEALDAESECIKVFGDAIVRDRIERFDRLYAAWDSWNTARAAAVENAHQYWEAAEAQKPGLLGPWGRFKTAHTARWIESHPNPGKPSVPYKRAKGDAINYFRFSESINIGSPDQMKVAFKRMNIPLPTRRNEKGEMKESLREEDLVHLIDDYPAVAVYIRYKKKRKFVDSFGEKFLAHEDVDGRIHTHFNQIIATGRMSSSDPNLQNIPSRGEDGHELRKNIVAPPGCKLITSDFAGIEDRICCFLSGDPVKRKMYDEGLDTHTETAKLLFNCTGEEARTPRPEFGGQSYRDIAKTFAYATLYGAYAKRLSKRLHTQVAEAQRLLDQFRTLFAGTFKWLDATQRSAVTSLVTRTVLGRPRYASCPTKPSWESSRNAGEYREATRVYNSRNAAIARELANHCIQGTSADITKQALVNLDANLPKEAHIILAVHDELVTEAPDALAGYVAALQYQAMVDAMEHFLPGFPTGLAQPTVSQDWRH